MASPSHSPEPWERGHTTSDGDIILDASGEYLGTAILEEDQKRIVACVNAMQGIDDPKAEIKRLRAAFARYVHDATCQHYHIPTEDSIFTEKHGDNDLNTDSTDDPE